MNRIDYRIISRPYATVAAIFAEYEPDESLLRRALFIGHGITLDENPEADNRLYFLCDSEMAEKLKEYKIPNPTLLQLLGTCRVIALDEDDAKARFERLLAE